MGNKKEMKKGNEIRHTYSLLLNLVRLSGHEQTASYTLATSQLHLDDTFRTTSTYGDSSAAGNLCIRLGAGE